MKILVLNCGSSSVKYTLFSKTPDKKLELLYHGTVERIGSHDACVEIIDLSPGDGKNKEVCNIPDHKSAVSYILSGLLNKKIKDKKEIIAVGHRVVHGGEKFKQAVVVDEDVKNEIRKCFDLAPLHNPHHLAGIIAIEELLPHAINAAVFDTAFHQTIPGYGYLYALPYYFYKKHNIRRYGFHGISHQYVAKKTAEILGRPLNELRLITCHLGNGCSVCAIKDGKSIDTSMGFTPLEGLIMGTRCGDIDPAIVTYLMAAEGLSLNEMNIMMTGQSGLAGISGISNDMKVLLDKMHEGDVRARLAIDMFCYRVRKYIGSYLPVLGVLDAVVFTAGIGERSWFIRKKCLENFSNFNIAIDDNLNKSVEEGVISKKSSAVKVLVVPTNEELMIARQVVALI
jgi:acetate kinase